MQAHDLANQCQSETQTTRVARARGVALPKAIKHVRQQLRRDALPRIQHIELDAALLDGEAHTDLAAGRSELDGVREQVTHHLLQTIGIGARRSDLSVELGHDLDAFPGRRGACQIDRFRNEGRQAERPRLDSQFAGADASEIQQVADDFQLRLRALLDARRDHRHFRIRAPLEQQDPIPSQDPIQR